MAANTLLVENYNIVYGAQPKNYTGAAMPDKYVSLKNYNHATIAISAGAWAGGTAAVTLSQATAVAGTSAKALAFSWYWLKTFTNDVPVKTAVVSNTFNLSAADQLAIIEVDTATLDVTNGFDCLTLGIATPGSNADLYSVLYILGGGSRFSQALLPTALTD